MPFVGALLAGLSRLLGSRIGQWALQLLAFFGLGFAAQQYAVAPLLAQIQSYASGAGGEAVMWMAYLNFDKAITMIMSAYAARATLQGARAFLTKRA